ncbi:MAG: redoxin domain-containing protein [Akkermansiaceae bacterium]|nr:redoxin domain-containing protein [Akkermansiaceae bacterium]
MRTTFLLLLSLCLPLVADDRVPPVLEIGKKGPDFTLVDYDGKEYSMEDFDDSKILVLIFTANHCPDARSAAPRMAELHEKYSDKGVAFVAIACNDPEALRPDELGYCAHGDTYEEMKPFAEENGWKFPYLWDGDTQKVTRAYGAQATPHVFILDDERILRYRGRIDDYKRKFGPLKKDSYVVKALDAMLAGEEIETKTTRAFGCSTKWSFKKEFVAKDQALWEALEEELDILDPGEAVAIAQNDTEKLRVVNFWSTTCGPCVAEFPDLVDTYRRFQNRPVELITVSLDPIEDRDKVLEFLTKQHCALSPRTAKSVKAEGRSTNNYIYKGNPDQLAEAFDPDWTGAMPLTLVIEPNGKIAWRHQGQFKPLELRRAIIKWLDVNG